MPFTVSPPYPDHSSGANNLAASITGSLANFFGTDEFEFSITSSIAGLLLNPRPYHRFSDASLDVVEVRIYHGLHFRFADEQARRQGLRVANWVFKNRVGTRVRRELIEAGRERAGRPAPGGCQ